MNQYDFSILFVLRYTVIYILSVFMLCGPCWSYDTGGLYGQTGTEWLDAARNAQKENDLKSAAIKLGKAAVSFQEEDNWAEASKALSKQARLYRDRLGLMDESIEAFEKVIDLHKVNASESKKDRNIAHYHNLIGGVFQRKGDYEQAIKVYKEALRLRIGFFGEASPEVAQIQTNLGTAYRYKGDFDTAIELYTEALTIRKSRPDRAWVKEAIIHNQLGEVYTEQKEPSLAEGEFILAANLFEDKAPDRLDYKEVVALNLGNIYSMQKDWVQAEEWLKIAQELADSIYGPQHRETAKVLVAIGDQKRLKGDFKESLKAYQIALEAMVPDFDPQTPYENPSTQLLSADPWIFLALTGKGEAHEQVFQQTKELIDMEAALTTYEAACEFSDLRRAAYWSDGAKRDLAEEVAPAYEKTILWANEMYALTKDVNYLERAFLISERGKAALILENLDREMAIPAEFLEEIKELEYEIGDLEKELFESKGSPAIKDSLQSKLYLLEENHGREIARLKREYLCFSEGFRDTTEIREQLDPDGEALLEYFFGADNLYAFLLTRDRIELKVIPLGQEFPERLLDLRRQLTNPPHGNPQASVRLFADASHQIYQAVFAPLEPSMEAYNIKELTIIPDGLLWYIPFEILLTSPAAPQEGSFRNLAWFHQKYILHYAYSGTLLQRIDRKEPVDSRMILAIAPDFSNSEPTRGLQADAGSSRGFSPLTWNLPEVREIAKLFKTDTLTSGMATEANFKSRAKDCAGLHFSTHASINDEAPMLSYIAFQNSGDLLEDDSLFLYELYGMDLPAEMVVLSACETGAGKLQNGEGVISLARGFAYGGCPSVVTSLWRADDQSTYEIMKVFYRSLFEGMDKAKAMQTAKQEYLEQAKAQFSHPYYWAHFVVIGDSEPISFEKKNGNTRLYWLGGIALLLIGIGVFIWRKKKRKLTGKAE